MYKSNEVLGEKETLQAMVLESQAGRDQERKRAEELQVENLRLQLELERYKKWYYGPRADRLQADRDVSQMLLKFAEDLDRKPIHPDDLPRAAGPAEELRRVKPRNLVNFENLPVSTHVYELSEAGRACPCFSLTRKEIGADESWQVEYLAI